MENVCDICGAEDASIYVCTPRPSDPHEIVCVMLVCGSCDPHPLGVEELVAHFRAGGGITSAIASVWGEFFEDAEGKSAADEFGFWFLTL